MNLPQSERLRQFEREKALYRYQVALEQHDFDVVAQVLREAETDAMLEEMIFELNEALAYEPLVAAREALTDEARSAALIAAALGTQTDTQTGTPMLDVTDQAERREQAGGIEGGESSLWVDERSGEDRQYPAEEALLSGGESEPGSRALAIPSWVGEQDESPVVAHTLAVAAALIARNSQQVSSYLKAANRLSKILLVPMARRQRVRTCYLLGMCYSAAGEYGLALNWADEAADLIVPHEDDPSMVELLYLRGAICTATLRLSDASTDYQTCVVLLRTREARDLTDADFEMELWARLAGLAFYMSQPALTGTCIREARALVPLTAGGQSSAAAVELAQALILRQRGQPEVALRHAFAAADDYTARDLPDTAARTHLMVAEIALDMAASVPEGTDRLAFAQIAGAHYDTAMWLARSINDSDGLALALLTRCRLRRLQGQHEPRIQSIEWIIRSAQKRQDVALLAQAYTSLADEFDFQGEVGQALNQYRQALEVLEGSDLLALGVQARRALLRDGERRTANMIGSR